jgi:hypothetical protein
MNRAALHRARRPMPGPDRFVMQEKEGTPSDKSIEPALSPAQGIWSRQRHRQYAWAARQRHVRCLVRP